jgi:hypothetical protein
LPLQYPAEVAVTVVPVMLTVTVMVMATPAVVLNLTTVNMVTNAGPTALPLTGFSDQVIMYASLCPKLNALLIPASRTTPQQLESAYSTSSVWGTTTVMLTNTVVPSTTAGGPHTNIKIRVEMNRIALPFVTSQGPNRACLRQKHSCLSFDTNSSRVASCLSTLRNFLFLLINPRRLPRAAPSDSIFQTATLGAPPTRSAAGTPRIARSGVSGLPIPLH